MQSDDTNALHCQRLPEYFCKKKDKICLVNGIF